MKDIAKSTSYWQKLMIARRRKTLILCEECHLLLHKGDFSPVQMACGLLAAASGSALDGVLLSAFFHVKGGNASINTDKGETP